MGSLEPDRREAVSMNTYQQTPMLNPQPIAQPLDHAQAQSALVIQHFRYRAALADIGLQVTRGSVRSAPYGT